MDTLLPLALDTAAGGCDAWGTSVGGCGAWGTAVGPAAPVVCAVGFKTAVGTPVGTLLDTLVERKTGGASSAVFACVRSLYQ